VIEKAPEGGTISVGGEMETVTLNSDNFKKGLAEEGLKQYKKNDHDKGPKNPYMNYKEQKKYFDKVKRKPTDKNMVGATSYNDWNEDNHGALIDSKDPKGFQFNYIDMQKW
jgi:hypothetical protein